MTCTDDWPAKIREVRENWLSVAAIAEKYDLNPAYIRYLQEAGKIEVLKIDRLLHVNPASLDAFLESQPSRFLLPDDMLNGGGGLAILGGTRSSLGNGDTQQHTAHNNAQPDLTIRRHRPSNRPQARRPDDE